MIKRNIDYDRETNNFLAMKKEKDLFNYIVNDVRFADGSSPITAQNKARKYN